MSLIHVTIHVSDIERSISFYRDNLDLQVVRRFESRGKPIAMLGVPDGTLLEIVGDGNGEVDCPDVSIGFSMNNAARLARRLDPRASDRSPRFPAWCSPASAPPMVTGCS